MNIIHYNNSDWYELECAAKNWKAQDFMENVKSLIDFFNML